MERLRILLLGLRRRSLMLLDTAGCPYWFASWYCRPTRAERRAFRELAALLKAEESEYMKGSTDGVQDGTTSG